MKTYFADTNIFIRFLLGDNVEQEKLARKYFQKAKDKKIRIVVLSQILIEVDYVLKKVYGLPRGEIAQKLSDLVSSAYFDIEDRGLWMKITDLYQMLNLDLVDIYLFEKAKSVGGEVLSFDKDFKKLKKV